MQCVLVSPCGTGQSGAEWRVDLDGTMERIGLRTDGKPVAIHNDLTVLSSACGCKNKTEWAADARMSSFSH